MAQPSPFIIDRSRRPRIPKRSWKLSSYWDRYFPLESDGTITFTPPWSGDQRIVDSKNLAADIIRRGKQGVYLGLASMILLCGIWWFLFAGAPFFPGTLLILVWCFQFYWREYFLPYWMTPVLKPCLVYDSVFFHRNWKAGIKRQGADGFVISLVVFMGTAYSCSQYWWEYQEKGFYITAGIALAGLLLTLYFNVFRLNRSREFPARVALFAAGLVLAGGWGYLCYWLAEPPPSKEMGRWGFERQSPPSEVLGILQDDMSPVNWDRKLQQVAYRGRGARKEWAAYFVRNNEFNELEKSLRENVNIHILREGKELSAQEWEDRRERNNRQKFPDWWEPSKGARWIYFQIKENNSSLLDSANEFSYRDGKTASVPMADIARGNSYLYGVLYDEEKQRMYFSLELRKISLFGHIIRRRD